MLAFGWTITSDMSDMEDLDITIPIGIFVVIMHALIGGLIFLDNEEHHKFHDYQGIQGWLLVIFRFILYAGFIFGIVSTKNNVNDKKKKNFLGFLSISGSIYFLSMPMFVITCNMMAPYNQ